jgi:hypothetical protein
MRQKMMLGLIVALTLLVTSCEKDIVTRGALDYKFMPVTASDGYFENRQVAYPEDIEITGSARSINDFSLLGSTVEVTGNLVAGDVVRGVVIDVDGVGVYRIPDVPVFKDGEIITIADSRNNAAFHHFMFDAMDYMSRYGKQDIIVSGYLEDRYGRPVRGATVEINIYNDLEVRAND